jgi:hypothetical protein
VGLGGHWAGSIGSRRADASNRGVEEGRLAVQGVTIAVGVLEKRPPIPSNFVGFV